MGKGVPQRPTATQEQTQLFHIAATLRRCWLPSSIALAAFFFSFSLNKYVQVYCTIAVPSGEDSFFNLVYLSLTYLSTTISQTQILMELCEHRH